MDDFAQELRKLRSRPYSATTYANREAEKVGQMVLANQFISGVRPELQSKVVGMEEPLGAIVLKDWFEEAKAKELAGARRAAPVQRQAAPTGERTPSPMRNPSRTLTPPTPPASSPSKEEGRKPGERRACFNSGLSGHMVSACPYEKAGDNEPEARGKPPLRNVTVGDLTPGLQLPENRR